MLQKLMTLRTLMLSLGILDKINKFFLHQINTILRQWKKRSHFSSQLHAYLQFLDHQWIFSTFRAAL